MNSKLSLLCWLFIMLAGSCKLYTFSGASIPSDVKTITVQTIRNKSNKAPNSIERILTEQIRQKLGTETGLTLMNKNGDYEITGEIVAYTIDPVSATDGSLSNKYKLTITTEIIFTNNKYPDQSWNQSFSQFSIYENVNFSSIEEGLILDNSKRIAQDIFNKALGNW